MLLSGNNDDSQAAENEKNADIISDAAEYPVPCDVTLDGRKLWKDGDWNTLCLPFSLGDPDAEEGHYFDGTLLEGATVKTLISTSFDDATKTLTLNFSDNLTAIEAGKPYIVKWPAQTPNYLENPVFTGVVISNDPANVETDNVNFVGTYSSVVFDAGTAHKDVLFLGGENSLYYPDGEAPTTVNACRAYFTLNGITAGDPANPQTQVKAFKLNFGDGDITTSLRSMENGQWTRENEAGAWYDTSGRRIANNLSTRQLGNSSTLKKGIYIHNGKKVAVK